MNETNQTITKKHHKLRSFFSAIFGIIAVILILMSINVVWLNRTLINTTAYTDTVVPILSKPNVQNFIAQNVSKQLVNSGPINDIASALLPASDLNQNLSSDQLKALVKPIVQSDIVGIIKSPSFLTLWKNTNQSVHAGFISQLKGSGQQLTLNFNPAVNGIVTELKNSQLSSVANHVSIGSNVGNVDIKGSKVTKIRKYYNLFQLGTIVFVIAAVVAIGLSILISVHRRKTVHRLLLTTGILALVGALILTVPQFISFKKNDLVTQDAIRTIITSVVHYLFIADITIGILCIVAYIVDKIWLKRLK